MTQERHPKSIKLKINGIEVIAEAGCTILEVARGAGIDIPTLCFLRGIEPLATCRICLVEEAKQQQLLPSCYTKVADGMEILTETERVRHARKMVLELILASHPDTCLVCDRHGRCLLRQVAARLGVGIPQVDRMPLLAKWEPASGFIVRDLSKCILCGRCIAVCHELVGRGAIDYHRRGFATTVASDGEGPLTQPDCAQCALCVAVCPTAALDHHTRHLRKEAQEKKTVLCHHCGCGCRVEVHLEEDNIVGRLPFVTPTGIEIACARGIYEDDPLREGERITTALLRRRTQLGEIEVEGAIEEAATLLRTISSKSGPASVAIWCSPLSSVEEGFLLHHLGRGILQTPEIHLAGSGILRTTMGLNGEDKGAGYPSLCTLPEIVESDIIVAVGSDISMQAPAVEFAVRRALRSGGAKLIVVDEGDENPLGGLAEIRISSRREMLALVLAYMGRTLISMMPRYQMGIECMKRSDESTTPEPVEIEAALEGVELEKIRKAAELILSAQRLAIVLGFGDRGQPSADVEEASFLAQASWHHGRKRAAIVPAGVFTNELGLMRVMASHQELGETGIGSSAAIGGPRGLASSIEKMRSGTIRALFLFGYDTLRFLTLRFGNDETLTQALTGLDLLVVADARMRKVWGATCGGGAPTQIVLPLCEHEEREGTFVGIDGTNRLSPAVARPLGASLPGVDLLAALIEKLGGKKGWNLLSVREEIKKSGGHFQTIWPPKVN